MLPRFCDETVKAAAAFDPRHLARLAAGGEEPLWLQAAFVSATDALLPMYYGADAECLEAVCGHLQEYRERRGMFARLREWPDATASLENVIRCREGLGSRQSHQISYPEQIELGDTAGTSTGQPQHAHAPSRPQGSPESVLVSVYGVHILAHCQSGQIHAKGWCPRAGHLARRRCHELDQQFKLFLH